MDMLLKFGTGADSSTFGLPHFATPHYQIGFAENLGLSILPFIYRFFEIKPSWNDEGEMIGFVYTQLRNNQTYITVYTLWFRLVTTAIIPFVLMLICNLGIIFYYRKNK